MDCKVIIIIIIIIIIINMASQIVGHGSRFELQSFVLGYHEYKDVWSPLSEKRYSLKWNRATGKISLL